MAIDRTLWDVFRDYNDLPILPCPQCNKGKVKPPNTKMKLLTANHVKRYANHQDWEPNWDVSTWSAVLTCTNIDCGQHVHLTGKTGVELDIVEDEDFEVRQAWVSHLKILSAHPSPPLLPLTDKLPLSLRQALKSAFPLYWTDQSSCINRLRTCIELLLDNQKIPRETKTKKNKTRRIGLDQRIKQFGKTYKNSKYLDGLKQIGNLGTHHYNKINHSDVLDSLDIIYHVLQDLYDIDDIDGKYNKLISKPK